MTQEHLIRPPHELVQQWWTEFDCADFDDDSLVFIATQAARWGADQELEACCEWLQDPDLNVDTYKLRAARRPKPPSLKKVAYDALDTYIYGNPDPKDKERTYNAIRRALESLPN